MTYKMRYILITIQVLSFLLTFGSCDLAQEDGLNNPIPTLASISPVSDVAHMPVFTLTAKGDNFVSGSKIVFNGSEKETIFVNSKELTCQINPEDTGLSSAIIQYKADPYEIIKKDVLVRVRNPSPGGSDSNYLEFTILDNHTFSEPKNISNNSKTLAHSPATAIAVDNAGNINIVWIDKATGVRDIYFSRSTDNGLSWSLPINISNCPKNAFWPDIAIDNAGNIDVIWGENQDNEDLYFSRSTDCGVSWSQPVNISNNSESEEANYPALAVDSAGNINVVWWCQYANRADRIYFSRSNDYGRSWSPAVNVTDKWRNSVYPDIAIDRTGNINIVWIDALSSNNEIFFSRSADNGLSWSQAVNISNNPARSLTPSIAVDSSGSINVVWWEYPFGSGPIQFIRSTDAGISWSPVERISDNGRGSIHPDIAIDSAGTINVVWYDNYSENTEIYFSRSTNAGSTWSLPVNISNSSGGSMSPTIAVDSAGNISVVWFDTTLPNWGIYFTRNTR